MMQESFCYISFWYLLLFFVCCSYAQQKQTPKNLNRLAVEAYQKGQYAKAEPMYLEAL